MSTKCDNVSLRVVGFSGVSTKCCRVRLRVVGFGGVSTKRDHVGLRVVGFSGVSAKEKLWNQGPLAFTVSFCNKFCD